MNFRYYIFLLPFLFFFTTTFSQQKDSLVQLTYEQLRKNYNANSSKDSTQARIYAKSYLKKSILEKNKNREAFSYLLLSDFENRIGNYENAIKYGDTCIQFATKLKLENTILFAYKTVGNAYNNLGAYQNSIFYNLKVDSIARKNNDFIQQIRSNHNIASIKEQIGSIEEASSIFLDNLKKLKTLPSYETKNIYTLTLISLTAIHVESDIEKAMYYRNMLKEHLPTDSPYLLNYYMLSGKIECQQKKYQKARKAFILSDSLASNTSNFKAQILSYLFSGKCLCEEGKYDEAIQILEKAKYLSKKKKFQLPLQQQITSSLAESYKEINNPTKAIENYSEADSINKIINTIKRKVSKEIEEQYDNVNHEKEIEKLKKATFKEQKSNHILKIIGAFLIVALIILIGVFLKNKQTNKKRFSNLLEYIKQLETQQKQTSIHQQKVANNKKIPNEKVDKLLKSLEKFEKQFEFLNPKTSLSFVAKKLNTNTSYVSKVINEHKGKSFINYITELRINYALQRIKNDKVFRSYSIKGIAEELGFKSEGSFSRAFKAQTGIYPSYFIKNITADS